MISPPGNTSTLNERFQAGYFSKFDGYYLSGDGGFVDKDAAFLLQEEQMMLLM